MIVFQTVSIKRRVFLIPTSAKIGDLPVECNDNQVPGPVPPPTPVPTPPPCSNTCRAITKCDQVCVANPPIDRSACCNQSGCSFDFSTCGACKKDPPSCPN